MVAATSAGLGVDLPRPRMVVARRVGQAGHGVAQPVIAATTKAGDLALARLDRDRAHAGVGGQGLGVGVAPSTVTDLGGEAGRGDGGPRVAKQRQEDLTVDVSAHGPGDLRGESSDLLDERPQRRDEGQHHAATGLDLRLARPCPSPPGAAG